MTDDYYLSFPPPWNQVPARGSEVKPADILKASPASLPKFGGNQKQYLTWRTTFLPCVHLAPSDISIKIMLLRATLLPHSKKMRELLDNNFIGTPDGYRNFIELLEQAYGGEDNLLATCQNAVLDLPVLKEGDLEVLDTLHLRLGTYLLEWRAQGGADHDETASKSFFNIVMSKIEQKYARAYVSWLGLNGLAKGLHTLHQWLELQLQVHRTVDVFHQKGGEAQQARQVAAAAAKGDVRHPGSRTATSRASTPSSRGRRRRSKSGRTWRRTSARRPTTTRSRPWRAGTPRHRVPALFVQRRIRWRVAPHSASCRVKRSVPSWSKLAAASSASKGGTTSTSVRPPTRAETAASDITLGCMGPRSHGTKYVQRSQVLVMQAGESLADAATDAPDVPIDWEGAEESLNISLQASTKG